MVVLTAALSNYNSGLYCNGRMLHSLALQGSAPQIFARLSKAGAPIAGVNISIFSDGYHFNGVFTRYGLFPLYQPGLDSNFVYGIQNKRPFTIKGWSF